MCGLIGSCLISEDCCASQISTIYTSLSKRWVSFYQQMESERNVLRAYRDESRRKQDARRREGVCISSKSIGGYHNEVKNGRA